MPTNTPKTRYTPKFADFPKNWRSNNFRPYFSPIQLCCSDGTQSVSLAKPRALKSGGHGTTKRSHLRMAGTATRLGSVGKRAPRLSDWVFRLGITGTSAPAQPFYLLADGDRGILLTVTFYRKEPRERQDHVDRMISMAFTPRCVYILALSLGSLQAMVQWFHRQRSYLRIVGQAPLPVLA